MRFLIALSALFFVVAAQCIPVYAACPSGMKQDRFKNVSGKDCVGGRWEHEGAKRIFCCPENKNAFPEPELF